MKKIAIILFVVLAVTSLSFGALADDQWPNGTVTVKVAANAGGGTDNIVRVLAAAMQQSTGEAFTVVNDSTGNGTVAYEAIRNAKPDGYTLLLYHSTMAIQYYQGAYGFNPADENNFTVIANVPNGGSSDVLVVPATAEYKTLDEFVAYCQANPGVIFGNQNGGFGQLEFLLLNSRAALDARFVDAGGQADTIISLLGGNINACFIGDAAASQYAESGDMICLAVCDSKRSELLPDVATFTELGYDIVFKPTPVLLGPAGMDPELVAQINAAFDVIATDEDAIKGLSNLNQSYTPSDPATAKQVWEDHCATIKEICGLAGYDVSDK